MTATHEVERICANVSEAQRRWCERYTFREWPEYFVRRISSFELDGTDDVPPTDWWWACFAHWYKVVSGNDAPELVCTDPGYSPSGIRLNG